MSHGNRVAEQRKLRKAVGHDAMQLMGAMSSILDERVFPTQALQADTIRLLVQRMEMLEAIVQRLQTERTLRAATPVDVTNSQPKGTVLIDPEVWPRPIEQEREGG